MNKLREEKGITMLALVIIVVILTILSALLINFSGINVDSSVDAKLEQELKMVQYAVLQQYMKYNTTQDPSNIVYTKDYNEDILDFVDVHYKGVTLQHTPSSSDEIYKKYYRINPKDLQKIGIQDSNFAYIINYYTGEVFNESTYKTSRNRILYINGAVSSNQESF